MNLFLTLFSYIYTHFMYLLERRIGYSVRFGKIPAIWINGVMTVNMEPRWRKWGVYAHGVNYFTVGSLVQGVSSRYIRDQKQYQSWLGAYLVRFKDRRQLTMQNYCDLAIADQKNWLKGFGVAEPCIKMSSKKASYVEDIKVGDYCIKLYEFSGGPSHSDVGFGSGNRRNRCMMSLMASMFNRSNPDLRLRGKNFLPSDVPISYETVILKGYIGVVDLEEDTKVILYGNAAMISDIDYYPLLKKDILDAFSSVVIVRF